MEGGGGYPQVTLRVLSVGRVEGLPTSNTEGVKCGEGGGATHK